MLKQLREEITNEDSKEEFKIKLNQMDLSGEEDLEDMQLSDLGTPIGRNFKEESKKIKDGEIMYRIKEVESEESSGSED